jgi:formylglycine-generating enzyme required for sulfatase activity
MEGLQIYNTTTRCVETWNGSNWIQSCYDNTPDDTPSTPDDVELCLTQDGLTYTYSAIAPPYVMPTSVKFYDDATLVGEDDTEPFEHTFDAPPSGEVTVVVTYPPFNAGDQPSDQIITIGEAKYTMIGILGGNFNMGFADQVVYEAAGGSHSVNVSSFSIGETEVTQGLWKAVWGDDHTPSPSGGYQWDAALGIGDAYPVYYVSWYDAIAFCNKLSAKESKNPVYAISGITDWLSFEYDEIPIGDDEVWNAVSIDLAENGYRLPTEAEWEYAARGGENYLFSGSNEIDNVAWRQGSSGSKEVKGKFPNGYGLYDMSGNVSEWCSDFYNVYSVCGRVENPLLGASAVFEGSPRVLRGGDWSSDHFHCIVSSRFFCAPTPSNNTFGFRVVLSL